MAVNSITNVFKKLMRVPPNRNFCPEAPDCPPIPSKWKVQKWEKVDFFERKKFYFWKCCRNSGWNLLPTLLATWWGPADPKTSGDANLDNSIEYSRSNEFLKFGRKHTFWCFSHTKQLKSHYDVKFLFENGHRTSSKDAIWLQTQLQIFSKNWWKCPQTEISVRGPPIDPQYRQNERFENGKKLIFSREKNFIFESVAEISVGICCRHFWQHDGDPSTPKSPETRIWTILWNIRGVTNF